VKGATAPEEFGLLHSVLRSFLLVVLLPALGWAQGTASPTFRSQSTVVLVPVLVYDDDGKVVFGLTARDFMIKDNGKEQVVKLDEAADSKPVSLVVAVQTSRRSARALGAHCGRSVADDPFAEPQLDGCVNALRTLGLMLEPFLHAPGSEMAIVGFDGQPKLQQSFTSDTTLLKRKLSDLPEGDSDDAILDALRYSIELLQHRPAEHRKVLLLISELHDHGSRNATYEETARRISSVNAEFYAIAFSNAASGAAELIQNMAAPLIGVQPQVSPEPTVPAGGPPNRGVGNVGLMPIIHAVADEMKTNIPQGIADLTGGEYIVFSNAHSFDTALGSLANHAQNRYQLSFQVTNPAPGPHKIEVLLSRDIGARVAARTSYWPNPEAVEPADRPADPTARR
jgi:VWFA-related protein